MTRDEKIKIIDESRETLKDIVTLSATVVDEQEARDLMLMATATAAIGTFFLLDLK